MNKIINRIIAVALISLAGIVLQGNAETIYRTGFEAGTGSPSFPDATSADQDINAGYNGWSGGQSLIHVISSDNSHNGSQSLKITDWGSSQPNLTITTQTNKDIYLTCWLKCASNGEYTFVQSKQSSAASMSEIRISTDADIEVSADNVWVSAGSFDVGTEWFAMQIKWIWNSGSGKYDQQTFYIANIGEASWTLVGTKATRFDQANLATIMITKENGSESSFVDDLTISDISVAPDPEAITIYETSFEDGTGSAPQWPDASGSDFDMSNNYDGWLGGQAGVHIVTSGDSHFGFQSYRASDWGSSQPSRIITTQSGHDVYFRFWTKCANNGEYTYLQSKQSSGATMSEIKISSDADFEVSADNVWTSVGSFDVGTNWFAIQIQWLWNGSSAKYDQQTFYAANIGDADWSVVGTKATRFDQANLAKIMITKESGSENAFFDDFKISDNSVLPVPPPKGTIIVIK